MKARGIDTAPDEVVEEGTRDDGDGVEPGEGAILKPLVQCYLHRAARSTVRGRDGREAKTTRDTGEENVGTEAVGMNDMGRQPLQHAADGGALGEVCAGSNND